MTRAFSAYTNEIDDVEAAVAEIMEQLDLESKNPLLKNTFGIVSCYAEYTTSGVFEALTRALPFEIVGITTIASMTAGVLGEMAFNIMVITSDELSFAIAVSGEIRGEDAEKLREVYQTASNKLSGKPAMMFSFAPLLNNFGSDFYVEEMDKISGGLSNFGTLAVDHNDDYRESRVLLNGEAFENSVAIVLIQGDIEPTFYIGSISDGKVFPEKGVVTASEGNILQEVNGLPVIEYLLSLGLTRNEGGGITGINVFPIIVDYNDGTEPVARVMFALTPEGYAVCGGKVPVGSTLSIGSFDPAEIAATTERTLARAIADKKHNVMLIFSCIGRYFSQGYDTTAEFTQLLQPLEDAGVCYLGTYSGGEICPVYDAGGASFNRNHNNTFIICAF